MTDVIIEYLTSCRLALIDRWKNLGGIFISIILVMWLYCYYVYFRFKETHYTSLLENLPHMKERVSRNLEDIIFHSCDLNGSKIGFCQSLTTNYEP